MLKNRDFKSSDCDWLIRQAMDFMLFATSEDIQRVSVSMSQKMYSLAHKLCVLNSAFESAFYKSMDNINKYFIDPAIENAQEEKLKTSSQILENRILSVTQKIINIKDEGATLDNLAQRIKSTYYNNQDAQRALQAITVAKRLKESESKDLKSVTNAQVLSNYDTYCANTYNILYDKYLEMLDLYQSITEIQSLIDALKIVEIVKSKEGLFSLEDTSDFLKNEETVIQTIKKDILEYLEEADKA